MSGKGSKQRPTDKKRYDENYKSINWTCPSEPEKTYLTKEQMDELRAVVTDCPIFYRWPEGGMKKRDG